ncbi:hypothetical protein B0I35DRAFT_450896 [Stachybotrys elegans]|uniref:Uncharacterized protein n=1 Tax=Stachybotrys elegans TaxID=80388 RepID=A0A8K0SXM4_9HYPO|nr:hypothetical protein B0I35DRAFT_450896 [Stachybotrys elegans]
MWLFRRRSGRKRTRSGANLSDVEGQPPSRALTEPELNREASIKKQRTDSRGQRRARTYSFSPGRRDSIRVDREHGNQGGRPDASSGNAMYERQPTLHNDRDKRRSTRKKNSKRRREELDREAEIKKMSNFTPYRPATDAWTAGRPMKKESKRSRTMPFSRNWDNPASDVSLPLPGSIHSTITFDSLAPRPTLRYAYDQRPVPARSNDPSRTGSQKRPIAERVQLPDEKLNSRRRIDELADDLDASDLRELMERDKRRRERKQQPRRAEKQRRDEAEAEKSGTPPPENLERIDPASAVITSSSPRHLPSDEPTNVSNENLSKKASDHFHPVDTVPEEQAHIEEKPSVDPQPESESVKLAPALSRTQPPVPSLSQTSLLSELLRSRKSRSKSTLASDREKNISPTSGTIPEDKALESDHQSGSIIRRFSLTSFWRRRTQRKMQAAAANSQTHIQSLPTSGQGPSRSQTQLQAQAQAQAFALAKLQSDDLVSNKDTSTGNYLSRKPSSGAPKRTRSRFREDLPEFPISPPDSRVQSPEAEPPLPALAEDGMSATPPIPIPSARYSSPTSGHRSAEMMRQTPTSMDRTTYGLPSPEPHQSMSLASIDSEGSWLSGKRVSRRTSAMRDSIQRPRLLEPANSIDSPTNSTEEELGIADDEYLSRLAPRRHSGHIIAGRRSGEGRPSSDEEDGDVRWGAVGARPYVVETHTHDREKMKSRQGMLNVDVQGGDDTEGDEASASDLSPVSPVSPEKPDVGRARSVHLGKGHVRNFSAGSAKLLDITPRTSNDEVRRGREKRRSAPMHM